MAVISSLYWSIEKSAVVAVVENKVDCPRINWSEDKYLMNSTVAMSDCRTHMQSAWKKQGEREGERENEKVSDHAARQQSAPVIIWSNRMFESSSADY